MWLDRKLGDHIGTLPGFAFLSDYFNIIGEGVPLIRIRDIGSTKTEVHYSGPFPPAFLVSEGDILVGMDGEFNLERWRGDRALLNQRVLKIFAKSGGELELAFAYYWLAPFLKKIEATTAATTVKHLSSKDIERAIVPSPDRDAQRAIALVLSVLDSQIEATEALIAKQEQVRAGLMRDVFTRGLDACGQPRPVWEEAPHLYHHTELGWLPKSWEVCQINDLIVAARAGCSVNSFGRPAFADEAGILKTSCVANASFDAAENKAVEPCEYNRLREPVVQGAIIVSRMNTPDLVGESGLVDVDAPGLYLPDRLWQLHPKVSVNSYWLSRLLQFHDVKERIKALATGTSGTMKNIDKAKFLSLLVPKPPPPEMAQLESTLRPIENSRNALAIELSKLQLLKSGLMQDLLTGKVSVAPLLEGTTA